MSLKIQSQTFYFSKLLVLLSWHMVFV